MKRKVELIYDSDCPNVSDARAVLLEAFARLRLTPSWTEWDRHSPDSPHYVRDYGSPTILVDGRDVAGARPGEASDSCRLYTDEGDGRFRGVPPLEHIEAALAAQADQSTPSKSSLPASFEQNGSSGSGWKSLFAGIPGIGAALLPVGVCPACWPVYAGLLSSLGLGFLLDTTYLLPVTVLFLGLALFALGFRARSRRGYGPLGTGVVAVVIVMVFKFFYASTPLFYGGLGLLIAASFWNAWPRRAGSKQTCRACATEGPDV